MNNFNYPFENDYEKLIAYVKKHPKEKIICLFVIDVDDVTELEKDELQETAIFQFNNGCFDLKMNGISVIFTSNENEAIRKCKKLEVRYLMSNSMLNEFVYN